MNTKPNTVGELVATIAPKVAARFVRNSTFAAKTVDAWIAEEARNAGWTSIEGGGISGNVLRAGVMQILVGEGTVKETTMKTAAGRVPAFRLA